MIQSVDFFLDCFGAKAPRKGEWGEASLRGSAGTEAIQFLNFNAHFHSD
jgi:hypothetical protein